MTKTNIHAPRATITRMLLIALVSVTLWSCGQKGAVPKDSSPQSADSMPVPDSLAITLVGVDSSSVFDLLRREHEVDYFSTTAGVFVRAIDSVGNSPSVYWVYSVNDSNPKVAADKLQTHDGDRVVWHLRRSRK